MKLFKVLSVLAVVFVGFVFSAGTVYAQKAKEQSSSKKTQTRAEFNQSIFKMYKAHKQEMKDLQIQFINKQFAQDLENEKAMIELRNKINPSAGPEANKVIGDLMEKKSKDFQEKNKKETEEFYSKKMAEKGKAFFDMTGQLYKEFEITQQPTQPLQPQKK